MKKREIKNISGIKINDSITMSVKHRRPNLRSIESLLIALCGYVSLIMIFFKAFDIPCSSSFYSYAVVFALIYGLISAYGQKILWVIPVTGIAGGFIAFNRFERIKTGFKLVFNIMYKEFTDSGINYFKAVNSTGSEDNINLFLIFAVWILAFVIFFFTVCKPNILIIVAVTFPVLEMCLYYGIEVPPLWSALLLAYWLALLSVCSSDLGEYYGGGGGFTRKDNVFFPKRRMKFKVTEKCGVIVISVVMLSALTSAAVMKLSGYERTDKIKQQRVELKTAINSFSMEDVASSVSDITSSLGITFDYQDNRLGKLGKITYNGKTQILVNVSGIPQSAMYLKGFNAAEYKNNEWFELDDEKYTELNKMFEKYGVYPQQFQYNFKAALNQNTPDLKIKIISKKKSRKFYTPYGIAKKPSIEFVDDNITKFESSKNYSAKFYSADLKSLFPYYKSLQDVNINYADNLNFTDEQLQNIKNFADEYNLNDDYSVKIQTFMDDYYILNPNIDYNTLMSSLTEMQYRKFVYENYLSYPDNDAFREIYNEYKSIIDSADISTATARIQTLKQLKEKMNDNVSYTLEPGRTPSNRDFVNYFLLENHKGYCVHYATAGVMLARMAGIPARYATGYISVLDDFTDDCKNADGSYTVKLPDNRSHAWAEVYIDGYGWIPFEFTAGYSDMSAGVSETTTSVTETTSEITQTTTVSNNSSSENTQSKKSSDSTAKITSSLTNTTSSDTSDISKGNTNSNLRGILNTSKLSSAVRNIIISVMIILIIFARRFIIVKLRQKKLHTENSTDCIRNNYDYVTKLLKYLGIKRQNQQYNEFAEYVETHISGKFFKSGDFKRFSDIVLKCGFSRNTPSVDELSFVSEFSSDFASKIYDDANIFRKIYIKLILVII